MSELIISSLGYEIWGPPTVTIRETDTTEGLLLVAPKLAAFIALKMTIADHCVTFETIKDEI